MLLNFRENQKDQGAKKELYLEVETTNSSKAPMFLDIEKYV